MWVAERVILAVLVATIHPISKVEIETTAVIESGPVVLVTVETQLVPIAILGAIAVIMLVTALVVAVPVAIFWTTFVMAAMEVALVTAFEMVRSGEVPWPTIITAPCFRLHSQSDHKHR